MMKRTLASLCLAASLVVLMPAPAHADLSLGGLTSAIVKYITNPFTKLFGDLEAAVDRSNAGGIKATQNLDKTIRDTAKYRELEEQRRAAAALREKAADNHPVAEADDLVCSVATGNQSVPLTEGAAKFGVARTMEIIANGTYLSATSGTVLQESRRNKIYCKLGVLNETQAKLRKQTGCTKDPMVEGAHVNLDKVIKHKDCIPFDAELVAAEFERMQSAGDNYNGLANPEMKEAVVAILAMQAHYPSLNAYSSEEEAKTLSSIERNKIIDAGSRDGNYAQCQALNLFMMRLCPLKSKAQGCDEGQRGGGGQKGIYDYLSTFYHGRRSHLEAGYGLPPANYCLSLLQIRFGQELERQATTPLLPSKTEKQVQDYDVARAITRDNWDRIEANNLASCEGALASEGRYTPDALRSTRE
jgi:hypothetical protein